MTVAVSATYVMTSETGSLAPMRAWLRAQLEGDAISVHDQAALVVAVGELCTNSIEHAYGGEAGQRINVTVTRHPDRFVLEVEDFGRPFDPDRYVEPDLDAPTEHGLGLYIAERSADELTHDVRRDRGTRWTLVKYFASARAARESGRRTRDTAEER